MIIEHDYEKWKVRTVVVKGIKFQCLNPINLADFQAYFVSYVHVPNANYCKCGCLKKRALFHHRYIRDKLK